MTGKEKLAVWMKSQDTYTLIRLFNKRCVGTYGLKIAADCRITSCEECFKHALEREYPDE